MDIEVLKCLMLDYGWELADPQPDKWYLRFKKDNMIFDYWITTGTTRFIKNNKTKYWKNNTFETITECLQNL